MFNILAIPTYLQTGAIRIATVDLIVLVVLLIALITGLCKGFMKQILSFLGLIASLILAFMLCGKVAGFIGNTFPSVTDDLKDFIINLFGLDVSIDTTTQDALMYALANSNIPLFLQDLISNAIAQSEYNINILEVLSSWVLTVICFISLTIVLLIVFAIIKKLFNFLTKLPIIKQVDKILGVIFSVLKALVVLILICLVVSTFFDVNAYLNPEDGVICVFNKVMTWVMDLPFIKNLVSKII